jgi:hypothetical protein
MLRNFRVTNYGGFAKRKLAISIQLEEQYHNIGEPAIAEVIFWQWAINSNDNDGRTILEVVFLVSADISINIYPQYLNF